MSKSFTEKQVEWLLRIFDNSLSLTREARCLYDSGHYRRSAFLALTAQEEFQKFVLVLKGESKTWIHKTKFKHFDDFVAKLEPPDFSNAVDQYNAKAAKEGRKAITVADIRKLRKELLNLEKLRTALLYEDETITIHREFIKSNPPAKLASGYIRAIEEVNDNMLPVVEEVREALKAGAFKSDDT